jgi:hypothetical protein
VCVCVCVCVCVFVCVCCECVCVHVSVCMFVCVRPSGFCADGLARHADSLVLLPCVHTCNRDARGIAEVTAAEVLDSRGQPTIEVYVTTINGTFVGTAPAGISRSACPHAAWQAARYLCACMMHTRGVCGTHRPARVHGTARWRCRALRRVRAWRRAAARRTLILGPVLLAVRVHVGAGNLNRWLVLLLRGGGNYRRRLPRDDSSVPTRARARADVGCPPPSASWPRSSRPRSSAWIRPHRQWCGGARRLRALPDARGVTRGGGGARAGGREAR